LCWQEARVTAESWNPKAAAAAGRGHLRASDADRDQVVDTLKAAFVQGRLTKDELGQRATQALASRTYGELAALTTDIAVRLIEAQPSPRPARTHAQAPSRTLAPAPTRARVNKKTVAWAVCMILMPATLGAAFVTYYAGFLLMFMLAFIGVTITAQPDH
jgi:Domain of unknown function (DUF1707)